MHGVIVVENFTIIKMLLLMWIYYLHFCNHEYPLLYLFSLFKKLLQKLSINKTVSIIFSKFWTLYLLSELLKKIFKYYRKFLRNLRSTSCNDFLCTGERGYLCFQFDNGNLSELYIAYLKNRRYFNCL